MNSRRFCSNCMQFPTTSGGRLSNAKTGNRVKADKVTLPTQESVRLLATHRYAMAVASVGVVVPQCMVLRAAVVPKCDRVLHPLEAHAQLGGLDVPIEHFENRVAFILAQADDVGGEKRFTNRHFLPVPGCVRTIGCSARG